MEWLTIFILKPHEVKKTLELSETSLIRRLVENWTRLNNIHQKENEESVGLSLFMYSQQQQN